MTKTTKTEAAQATEAKATEAKNIIMDTIESVQEKIGVPSAAREFVARQAATAQERAESVHEGANKLNADVEKAAVSLIGSYAKFTQGLIDMSAANVTHALETVEKVAAAKSLSDAMQIQADYVRESAKANYERVKTAAETAKDTVSEVTAAARDNASKMWPYGKKAA